MRPSIKSVRGGTYRPGVFSSGQLLLGSHRGRVLCHRAARDESAKFARQKRDRLPASYRSIHPAPATDYKRAERAEKLVQTLAGTIDDAGYRPI
jgi:hypothetical protein